MLLSHDPFFLQLLRPIFHVSAAKKDDNYERELSAVGILRSRPTGACVLRRVAGWVAGMMTLRISDDWDHSGKFPA